MLTRYETYKLAARVRKRKRAIDMTCLRDGGHRPLAKDDIPLVFNTHNDIKLMPSFLAHYRKLGVSRFICVDDVSSDGTREYLLSQADVDVWKSALRYRDARRGREWREALFDRYGGDRWYLNVDSDEFLIYQDSEHQRLDKLIQVLERQGEKRLAAPMIDMYPIEPLGSAMLGTNDDRMPWEIADHFDGSGYEISYTKRAISITGGPRKRKFAHVLELIKYPLIYWDRNCSLSVSIHQPLPCERNFLEISGVLLHFKFFSDYREKIEQAVSDGQYFDGAAIYRKMLDDLEKTGEFDFAHEHSVRFSGSRQLLELGFIAPIPFPSERAAPRENKKGRDLPTF
ncbi:glycosyltransferase family 2 protein [Ensifer sp. BR816]|uniref:glycosyltransferase family 2 protein n=1 Tax=Rhizobium sp. (strain BR816) TaxID=1057002 RepID=UPI00069724C6|nr:glycosyltransferase family 2 protein [Ensifer sp. BR816]